MGVVLSDTKDENASEIDEAPVAVTLHYLGNRPHYHDYQTSYHGNSTCFHGDYMHYYGNQPHVIRERYLTVVWVFMTYDNACKEPLVIHDQQGHFLNMRREKWDIMATKLYTMVRNSVWCVISNTCNWQRFLPIVYSEDFTKEPSVCN